MNKWQKAGLIIGVTGATLATAHIINKMIFAGSVSKNITGSEEPNVFPWNFGDITYIKKGSGSPVLLVHDLMPYSSSYEWKDVIDDLAKKHTVYAIDLLGCGHSAKPNITYTTYLYVQLLTDFVKKVIGKRTDVVVTGDSVPMVVMSCYCDDSLYNNIVMINPESLGKSVLGPRKHSNIIRNLLNSPIIGTMIYNCCVSKKKISKLFSNEENSEMLIDAYYESAHLGGSTAKCLYNSIACRYTTSNILKAVSEINNSIFIIGGNGIDHIKTTINDYYSLNSAIESYIIEDASKLPQLEKPAALLEQLNTYL